jgi:tetratricopeptide (TPR) repeat protein
MAGSPEAQILVGGISENIDGYQRAKQLWLQQVERHPDNPAILRNAGAFLGFSDEKLARELFEKAYNLNPEDPDAMTELARTYELERIKTPLRRTRRHFRKRLLHSANAARKNCKGAKDSTLWMTSQLPHWKPGIFPRRSNTLTRFFSFPRTSRRIGTTAMRSIKATSFSAA